MRNYRVTTWADGYGIWHAKATYTTPLGNDGQSERIFYNSRRALQRAIRKEITERAATWHTPNPLRNVRLSYEVAEYLQTGNNWGLSYTIKERANG